MKAHVLLPVFGLCFFACSLPAQESPAAAAARRDELEERYRSLSGRLEKLEEALPVYQKRMEAFTDELRKLREEVSRLNNNTAQAAGLESLKLAIKEVDEKRIADNKKVVSALAEFGKTLTDKPAAAHSNPPASPAPKATDKGYDYFVRAKDNPYIIASTINKMNLGFKVTAQQIQDANPGVIWTKLKIGQKLFIPGSPKP
jgi:hypothetical protein